MLSSLKTSNEVGFCGGQSATKEARKDRQSLDKKAKVLPASLGTSQHVSAVMSHRTQMRRPSWRLENSRLNSMISKLIGHRFHQYVLPTSPSSTRRIYRNEPVQQSGWAFAFLCMLRLIHINKAIKRATGLGGWPRAGGPQGQRVPGRRT